jgi:hypothetical protein
METITRYRLTLLVSIKVDKMLETLISAIAKA